MGFSKTAASLFSVLPGGNNKNEKVVVDPLNAIDALEQGFAQTLARDETRPEAVQAPKRKMTVTRSEDHLRYVLHNEDLTPVLEARVTADRVQVFAAGSHNDVPAFTLAHDKEKQNWQIASNFCDRCAYRNPLNTCQKHGGQRIGYVRHSKESIGDGTAMCMDVDIPEIDSNGQFSIWCPLCIGADDARIELSSMRPKWNQKLQSLCMDFKGRVEAASAKNFQLCDGNGGVVLLYGKKASGSFALEFEHPLSSAQAFTIALTTMHWQ